jgi:hypothetical protein
MWCAATADTKCVAAAELTGPNLYRIVDQMHPTLITDDAHRLLERQPELAHIINVSWTRNTARIPRQERVNGQWVTHWFDAFCPKIIAGINVHHDVAKAAAREGQGFQVRG